LHLDSGGMFLKLLNAVLSRAVEAPLPHPNTELEPPTLARNPSTCMPQCGQPTHPEILEFPPELFELPLVLWRMNLKNVTNSISSNINPKWHRTPCLKRCTIQPLGNCLLHSDIRLSIVGPLRVNHRPHRLGDGVDGIERQFLKGSNQTHDFKVTISRISLGNLWGAHRVVRRMQENIGLPCCSGIRDLHLILVSFPTTFNK
jgi:hypothetical protein